MSKLVKTACCALVVGLATILLFSSGRDSISYFFADTPPAMQNESSRVDLIRMGVNRRVEETELLVRALSDGRSTLGETAPEFLKIHQSNPAFEWQHQLNHNSGTLLESASRDLATRAVSRETNLQKRAELAYRLEAEFQALFPNVQPLHLVSMSGSENTPEKIPYSN
jgi:hypothetical protein